MSRVSRLAVLLLLFAVALAASAPAHLLNRLVPRDTLYLQGFAGSLWRGSASRCALRIGPSRYLQLGAVQWSLSPLSLLRLAPRIRVHSSWGPQQLVGIAVLRDARSMDLEQVEARVSADLLRQLVPVALGGSLSLQLPSLRIRQSLPVAGEGRLVWQDAVWHSPRGPLPLGTYAVDLLSAPGQSLAGQVLTVSGPVQASGTVQLRDRAYTVDILVGAGQTLDPQLQQALSLLAAPQGDAYRLRLDGQL
ncbi:MAG: type II secretion system protein N [Halioglobus sp.]|nr:type II secretion system protein N [Halioglobus sp.]